jgi:NAD(P)-dependent dehydrogenase (short-subunit alcohol dehydrogenase family)
LSGEGLAGKVVGTKLDVRDHKAVDAWLETAMKNHKQLHGGANVAGIGGGFKPTNVGDIVAPKFTANLVDSR